MNLQYLNCQVQIQSLQAKQTDKFFCDSVNREIAVDFIYFVLVKKSIKIDYRPAKLYKRNSLIFQLIRPSQSFEEEELPDMKCAKEKCSNKLEKQDETLLLK